MCKILKKNVTIKKAGVGSSPAEYMKSICNIFFHKSRFSEQYDLSCQYEYRQLKILFKQKLQQKNDARLCAHAHVYYCNWLSVYFKPDWFKTNDDV